MKHNFERVFLCGLVWFDLVFNGGSLNIIKCQITRSKKPVLIQGDGYANYLVGSLHITSITKISLSIPLISIIITCQLKSLKKKNQSQYLFQSGNDHFSYLTFICLVNKNKLICFSF